MVSSMPTNTTPLAGCKNISVAVEGSMLYLCCDLSQDFGTSSSGKSVLIASSSGNKALGSTNAFLGLNLFCKSLDSRRLTDDATSELREMTEMGNYCQWQIEGGKLCILIDFNNVGDKVAASGKSVLLASSGGNKVVGKTGIVCGLNCYVPLGKKFLVEKLSTIVNNASMEVGDCVELDEGFSIRVESETQIAIHYEGENKNTTSPISMPPMTLRGDIAVALLIKVTSKKQKTEAAGGAAVVVDTVGKDDFAAASSKSKNLMVRFHADGKEGSNGCGVVIDLRFDPTQNFGRSASGKSTTVATSSGWCDIGHGVSIMFNAYKPNPQLTPAEIKAAVNQVLEAQPPETVASLSFKTVMTEVEKILGVAEKDVANLKAQVKERVTEYMNNQPSTKVPPGVKDVVAKILGSRERDELAQLSLKTVIGEVLSALEEGEHGDEEEIKCQVKDAVMQYLRRNIKFHG